MDTVVSLVSPGTAASQDIRVLVSLDTPAIVEAGFQDSPAQMEPMGHLVTPAIVGVAYRVFRVQTEPLAIADILVLASVDSAEPTARMEHQVIRDTAVVASAAIAALVYLAIVDSAEQMVLPVTQVIAVPVSLDIRAIVALEFLVTADIQAPMEQMAHLDIPDIVAAE